MAGFGFLVVAFAVLLFIIFIVASVVRIVNEYERGVVFMLGRVQVEPRVPVYFSSSP